MVETTCVNRGWVLASPQPATFAFNPTINPPATELDGVVVGWVGLVVGCGDVAGAAGAEDELVVEVAEVAIAVVSVAGGFAAEVTVVEVTAVDAAGTGGLAGGAALTGAGVGRA